MTRTGFRNFWLFVVFVLLAGSVFVMRQSQDYQAKIDKTQSQRERLTRDLQAGAQLSAALAKLDNLTIDENEATRLDILRHLGLEKSDLKFTVSSKSEQKIGRTKLYVRQFNLTGALPYASALEQVDWLHGTKKVAISKIEFTPSEEFPDGIKFSISGSLYGLDKNGKTANGGRR